jgi:hypothetical protein
MQTSDDPGAAAPARQETVEGFIGHYGLSDWWLATFDADERPHIEERYRPPLPPEAPPAMADGQLTHGRVTWPVRSAAAFLTGLASWFFTRRDRHLARRMLAKAEQLLEEQRRPPVLDWHFLDQALIRAYYPDRRDPVAFAQVVVAAERQIALAPRAAAAFRRINPDAPLPEHLGYRQLAIAREKQGRLDEAIRLSRQALSQGWAGDWERRIARIERKKTKRGRSE